MKFTATDGYRVNGVDYVCMKNIDMGDEPATLENLLRLGILAIKREPIPLPRWVRFRRTLRSRIEDAREWLGEKIAGRNFDER